MEALDVVGKSHVCACVPGLSGPDVSLKYGPSQRPESGTGSKTGRVEVRR